MSTGRPVTAEELLAMGEGRRELIDGEVVELTPPGYRHGVIEAKIAAIFSNFVRESGTGVVVCGDSGFKLTVKPDTVRAPDVAVISKERAAGLEDEVGYPRMAPDLAVEIVSPSDSFADVESKARMWLEHGTRIVWILEPDSRRVLVHEPGRDRRELQVDETLDGGEVLPGFAVTVAALFEG